MTPAYTLKLPPDLTILAVGTLLPHWLSHLDQMAAQPGEGPCAVEIDAESVTEVDSAGLQLLVALGNAVEARGWALRLHRVSEPLALGCQQLGLGPWLAARQPEHAGCGALA